MARSHRQLVAGGIYHVMNRGNRRSRIFLVDGDWILFLELLGQLGGRLGWQVYGYCLMENHYHLLVETPEPDLATGMQRINSEYAQWFNKCHGFVGHVFQGRYHSVLVDSDWHFLELSRYMALNPVRAGLCESPSEWRWGSYRRIVRNEASPLISAQKLLEFFGPDAHRAREALRGFVEDDFVRLRRVSASHDGV